MNLAAKLVTAFVAAGLAWGLVAGVFGALTAKSSILFTQALPGAIALLLVLLAARGKNDAPAQPARTQ